MDKTDSKKTVLVTGGCGYIGSHCCVSLVESGYEVIIIDDFSNSHKGVLYRLKALCGGNITFIEQDVRDEKGVARILEEYQVDGVVHFAALKSVGESSLYPLEYYDVNVNGLIALLRAMSVAGVRNLVFSSSATVYGQPPRLPIVEEFPTAATNAYGRTKLYSEEILKDLCRAEKEWNVVLLRYFNPAGAHQSGLIGECPKGIPANLIPFITQVAMGKQEKLRIYGSDYDTYDGTGIRDFIHVVDLAEAHVAALHFLKRNRGLETFNLGTGRGVSVLEAVETFRRVSGRDIKIEISARRTGDVAECWADPSKAEKLLGWTARFDFEKICKDAWEWQMKNPNGYDT